MPLLGNTQTNQDKGGLIFISKEKMIKFHKSFKEPIIEGIKTSTIRRHFNGKVGDKYRATVANNNYIEPSFIAVLKITSIQRIRFDEINEDISRTEGYLHKDILADALLKFYPELTASSLLYYIQFEVVTLLDSFPDIIREHLTKSTPIKDFYFTPKPSRDVPCTGDYGGCF